MTQFGIPTVIRTGEGLGGKRPLENITDLFCAIQGVLKQKGEKVVKWPYIFYISEDKVKFWK